MSVRKCPTPEELSSYVRGGLPEDATEALAEHIETCVICDATVEELERQGDSLFRGLRRPASPLPELDSPEYRRAMEAAEAAGLGGIAPVTPPVAEPSLSELGRLGEYKLLRKLGIGGMGTVYKARQTRLGKTVALKVLASERTGDPRAVARFENEMKAVGQLSHPNIVQAYDARDIDGTTVLVMEYVDGLDLAKLVQRAGPLPIADACELIRQTAVGLQYIYENGLVHRDVKPSNLMLTPQGQVKILDLGLALLGAGGLSQISQRENGTVPLPDGEMTAAGLAMGTPDYIAPEQADDSHRVDIRADIYSLGCTLYHLLTGRAPFSGPNYKTPLNKVVGHARDTVPTVRALRASIPDELSRIVERMMAKDPAARFATPAEVAAALTPFAAHGDLASLLATAALPRPAPADAANARLQLASSPPWWRRRSTQIAAAAAIPLLFVLGVVIFIATDNGTVKIEISDPSANVNVKVDGRTIEITGLEKPLKMKAGKHELLVTSGEFETVTKSFTIRRGDNPVLRVTLERIPSIVGPEPHQTPLHPAPAGQVPSGTATAGQPEPIRPPLTFARPQVASVAHGQFAFEPPGWRLVAYKGNIYFAPWNDGTANPSKIFRYNPADGLRNGVNHTKLAETSGRFTTMKEMGGSLYYAASTGFIRKFDGTTISPITGSPLKVTDYVTAMAELNGKQYFGTVSGFIYEYSGSAWRTVYENQWSSPVSDLCAWKGSLFAGLYGDVSKNNGLAVKSNADVLTPTSWQTVISGVYGGTSLFLATPNYLYATPIDDVDSHKSTIRRSSNGVDFKTISGPGPFKFPLGNPLWSGARAYIFENGGPNQFNNGYLVTDDGVTTARADMGDWPYGILAATDLNGQIYAIGLQGPYHVVGNVYLLVLKSAGKADPSGVH